MKYDYKGIKTESTQIDNFVKLLDSINPNSLWNYQGLTVEIDPTVDYTNSNVLIRWTDINEGFNDKLIFSNLCDFNLLFSLVK